MENFQEIQELLAQRADLHTRLRLIPYDGTPEIKMQNENRYLYVRKREGGRITSTYVGEYTDLLYQTLLRDNRESRAIRKQIRQLDKQLALLGYKEEPLSPEVELNLDLARANIKTSIYDQAVLEGIATTFPQTEDILENGIVHGVKADDVRKILNLKHAWEFILDKDVISYPTDFSILRFIAGMVNEGSGLNGGKVRGVPVTIGGSTYVPPLPIESVVRERIEAILSAGGPIIDTAIQLCLYCMKAQIFLDGNKRSAIIFANHYLISHGAGLLVVPEARVPEFKELLIKYYEGDEDEEVRLFMKEKCLIPLKNSEANE